MTDWKKRIWYEGKEPPHTELITDSLMAEDWRYTKSDFWFSIIDHFDLKVMMRKSKMNDGARNCIITYERVE